MVRQIFERMKAIPKSEIVNIRYREKMEERKALLQSAKSDYAKAAAELDTLRAEAVSYTHLDVYKRQVLDKAKSRQPTIPEQMKQAEQQLAKEKPQKEHIKEAVHGDR